MADALFGICGLASDLAVDRGAVRFARGDESTDFVFGVVCTVAADPARGVVVRSPCGVLARLAWEVRARAFRAVFILCDTTAALVRSTGSTTMLHSNAIVNATMQEPRDGLYPSKRGKLTEVR